MPSVRFLRGLAAASAAVVALSATVYPQDVKPSEAAKAKTPEKVQTPTDRPADLDVARYCANVAPSIAEARIARQTKRLAELSAAIEARIAALGKAEAAAREWIAKRDELMDAARDDLVAIYGKMEPESAARQLGALDDRTAAAILGKLKPSAAGPIFGEMEPERASRLQGLIAGPNAEGRKS
jgi:flagellar motility protein MotE (MotC chaperone)